MPKLVFGSQAFIDRDIPAWSILGSLGMSGERRWGEHRMSGEMGGGGKLKCSRMFWTLHDKTMEAIHGVGQSLSCWRSGEWTHINMVVIYPYSKDKTRYCVCCP